MVVSTFRYNQEDWKAQRPVLKPCTSTLYNAKDPTRTIHRSAPMVTLCEPLDFESLLKAMAHYARSESSQVSSIKHNNERADELMDYNYVP
jgi:hypothetical protein